MPDSRRRFLAALLASLAAWWAPRLAAAPPEPPPVPAPHPPPPLAADPLPRCVTFTYSGGELGRAAGPAGCCTCTYDASVPFPPGP